MRLMVYSPALSSTSLLDGVEQVACRKLGIPSLRHRSALRELTSRSALPKGVVAEVHGRIAANWAACRSAFPISSSTENWRWRAPVTGIARHNASSEVMLERALVAACERTGRTDWSNQVPIASGIAGPSRERRRAIDLVHQTGPGAFQFIELKVASDTPLYAAVEIIAYACVWLLSRQGPPGAVTPILEAGSVDAVVLAPEGYYRPYQVSGLAALLNEELAGLGAAYGVGLAFRYEAFPDALSRPPFTDEGLLAVLDHRRPVR